MSSAAKAAKSEAGIQIYTADSRAMSREHIVIDVKNVPGKGFVHTLSLYKEKVNPTFIGSEPLVYGDRIVPDSRRRDQTARHDAQIRTPR